MVQCYKQIKCKYEYKEKAAIIAALPLKATHGDGGVTYLSMI